MPFEPTATGDPDDATTRRLTRAAVERVATGAAASVVLSSSVSSRLWAQITAVGEERDHAV